MKTNQKSKMPTNLWVESLGGKVLTELKVEYVDELSWQEKMRLIEYLYEQVQVYQVLKNSCNDLDSSQRQAVERKMDHIKTLVIQLV